MKRRDFAFHLPRERIARFPADHREESRLMVVDRSNGKIHHSRFSRLEAWLDPSDFMVINNTRVIPARLFASVGTRRVELLWVRSLDLKEIEVFARPARVCVPGRRLKLENGIEATVTAIGPRGLRRLRFDAGLDQVRAAGYAPLPPYIKRSREEADEWRAFDLERYQTVYARHEGSIAAPTAGLHFTPGLLERIRLHHGVEEITLTVGPATFQPIEVDNLDDHRMGPEEICIPQAAGERILNLRRHRRLVAVGTTTVRSLETWVRLDSPCERFVSELFIRPGFRFQMVDRLITNFHLPESSLFVLVCAFAGMELMRLAYELAVREGYRFFSYGDAMLIR
ncbi:MAG: tRNA preQ1(34) S-adenosylmethionine ribosyltransferase-isomerase QueA [Candidatus Aminicenantes bacterium]|nr:tRNA preQ1(34) S-adenosylmethionine ribosyltransferase-isomerase QueA [Candidatus Aminicenantes bacterium]